MPKASAPRFHQSNGSRLDNALLALRKQSRVLRHRRAFADCFGANPVASALGNRPGRDPGAAVRTYHADPKRVLKTGTIYFGGNRNFLLWSDIAKIFRNRPTFWCQYGRAGKMNPVWNIVETAVALPISSDRELVERF